MLNKPIHPPTKYFVKIQECLTLESPWFLAEHINSHCEGKCKSCNRHRHGTDKDEMSPAIFLRDIDTQDVPRKHYKTHQYHTTEYR